MKDLLESIVKAQVAIANLKPTFCGEICYKMRQGVKDFVETVESHYTASGTIAIIKDIRDGQEYTVEIKPLKRKKDESNK